MTNSSGKPSHSNTHKRLLNTDSTRPHTDMSNNDTLWLCLRLTHLALNSLGIALNSEQPAIVTYQQQVWQCNTQATKSGVHSGMSVNHALMLNPALQLHEREHHKEAIKLEELSYWAYRFTSFVSAYNAQTLLLEIGKSINLFKSLSHLVNLLSNDLVSFRIEAKQGFGSTPKAAYIGSFSQTLRFDTLTTNEISLNHLKKISLVHLDIDAKTLAQLHNCGFESLGDLSSIPNRELGVRFGKRLLDYLDKLWGKVADPQIAITPPETFHASVDFAEPIHNLGWIQQQLTRLLTDLANFLTRQQLICRSFTWRFYQENNRLLETVTVAISSKKSLTKPDQAISLFNELTQLKLASIQLSWEFSSIELSSSQLVPVTLFHDDLFDPKPDNQQFSQLIDKLSNRLGQNTLFRVVAESEHLPELANGRRHATTHSVRENHSKYTPSAPSESFKDEPLWLLEQPKRLAQQENAPLLEGPLTIIHGPNRVSSHWWAKPQSRDYFIARQCNGRLLWVFFDRGNRSWYLHGLFA